MIVGSGAVKHEDFVDTVKSSFTKLPSDSTTAAQLVANEPSSFTGSEVGEISYMLLSIYRCDFSFTKLSFFSCL